MRIVISNDDGIHARGLEEAIRALEPMAELFVVAPSRPRSATGHAITLHKPLRMWEADDGLPVKAMACNGMPADCVTLGHFVLAERRTDLVVAGINNGANLGWDLTYSGTVSAAMEGAVLGIPAIAISVTSNETSKTVHFEAASKFLSDIVPLLGDSPMPPNTFLNVNVPNIPSAEVKGIRVARVGKREYVDRLTERKDPWEQTYYWQAGVLAGDGGGQGTDVEAVKEGYISVTPVHLDMTLYESMDAVSRWLRPLQ
jgi:5'-nucleotidase